MKLPLLIALLSLPALAKIDAHRVLQPPAADEIPPCGTAESCSTLARAYAAGEGAPQRWSIARILFRRACELGSSDGCLHGGVLEALGVGGEQQLDAAIQHFERRAASASPGSVLPSGSSGV